MISNQIAGYGAYDPSFASCQAFASQLDNTCDTAKSDINSQEEDEPPILELDGSFKGLCEIW